MRSINNLENQNELMHNANKLIQNSKHVVNNISTKNPVTERLYSFFFDQ